jgi:hypothetical protein
MADSDSDNGVLGKLAGSLALLTASLYASGYMVIFSAGERLGISDPGGDFFKYKYIQVGAYCEGFITCFAGLGYLLSVSMKNRQDRAEAARTGSKDGGQPPPVAYNTYVPSWESLVALFVVEIALIAQGIIVVPGTWGLPWMLPMIGYLLLAMAAGLAGVLAESDRVWIKRIVLGMLMLLASLSVIGCLIIRSFAPAKSGTPPWWLWMPPNDASSAELDHYRWTAQAAGTVFLLLLCLFLGRLGYVIQNLLSPAALEPGADPAQTQQVAMLARANRLYWCATVLPLMAFGMFDAVIGFAAVIYPYVPIAKGGANYASAPIVDIHPSDPSKSSMPRCVILLETSQYLYVTSDTRSDRQNWGKLGSPPLQKIQRIPLTDVGDIEYRPWDPIHLREQPPISQP